MGYIFSEWYTMIRRLINVLKLLTSFTFNNSVLLTQCLTIILLKSVLEMINIISHYNHLIISSSFILLLSVLMLRPNPTATRSSYLWARSGWQRHVYNIAVLQIVFHLLTLSRCYCMLFVTLHMVWQWVSCFLVSSVAGINATLNEIKSTLLITFTENLGKLTGNKI